MSFSSELKENLSKKNNLANKEEVKYELMGYFISNNTTYERNKIQYITENEYNINRFSKLLFNMGIQDFKIGVTGKLFWISCQRIAIEEWGTYEDNHILLKETMEMPENLLKALIRGIFLGSGSVNNPEKKYHLEILLSHKKNAEKVQTLLKQVSIETKWLERKKSYSLYLKEGEEISKFLAFIGATQAVLSFEQIRVMRDMKNNINRKVNCETANLGKTVKAAVRQIEAIKKLKENGSFKNLPDNLKEIAELRLEHPDASLIELGTMLQNPIGKSGVNHRMQAILELAEK